MAATPVVERSRRTALVGDDPVATLLVQRRLVPEAEVERCFHEAARSHRFVEERVIERGLMGATELLVALETEFFCPAADLRAPERDPGLLALVPRALALRLDALPVGLDGDSLRVAMPDPRDEAARRQLAQACGRTIVPAVALRHELRAAVERAHAGAPAERPAAPAPPAASRPVLRAVPKPVPAPAAARELSLDAAEPMAAIDDVLRCAVQRGATDVHFEPCETGMAVRLRVDGVLRRVTELPKATGAAVTSRLKVLGRMDIAEKRAPQDGRASVTVEQVELDLRVSSLPSRFGEKVVLRLLRKDSALLDVRKLDMPPAVRTLHAEMIAAPMGLFLVTGPTGSGKTTTLYATLAALDREELSIVTLEDPIEYSLKGITQVQIHEAAGMTFAAGLHSILRQDPDVILVGEIRDAVTAEIACRAALTGHKVFSTLHTNDACQAVTRLLEMGVSAHLVTATLKGVVAQRLLRRCCRECAAPRPPNEVERHVLRHVDAEVVHEGAGCESCGGSGYAGRIAVYEYFKMEDEHQKLVLQRSGPLALRRAAQERGMTTLAEAGVQAVLEGRTTVAEVQRVLLADELAERACPGCGRGAPEEFAVCPYCEHVLRASCGGCGGAMEPGWSACPRCGVQTAAAQGHPHCSRCAARLESGWTACPYCGEAT